MYQRLNNINGTGKSGIGKLIEDNRFGLLATAADQHIETIAEIDHIVACANALEGIENPQIHLSKLAYDRDKARQERDNAEVERDQLRAALKRAVELKRLGDQIKQRAEAFVFAKENGDIVDLEDDYLIAMRHDYNLRKAVLWQRIEELIQN